MSEVVPPFIPEIQHSFIERRLPNQKHHDHVLQDETTGALTINYQAGQKTLEYIHDLEHKITCLKGVVGSGKTVAGIMKFLLFKTLTAKSIRLLVVRSTLKDLRLSTAKALLEWFPPYFFGKYNQNDVRFDFHVALNGCTVEIMFLGLDNQTKSYRLGSIDYSDYILDEANLVPQDVFVK